MRWIKYVLLILLAAALVLNRGFKNLLHNYLEYKKLSAQKQALDREYVELQNRRRLIKEKGPYLEGIVRKELRLMKPDEIEYKFPPPKEEKKK